MVISTFAWSLSSSMLSRIIAKKNHLRHQFFTLIRCKRKEVYWPGGASATQRQPDILSRSPQASSFVSFFLGNDFVKACRKLERWYGRTCRWCAHACDRQGEKEKAHACTYFQNRNDHSFNTEHQNQNPIAQVYLFWGDLQDKTPLEYIPTIIFKTHKLLYVQWKNTKIN